MDKTVVLLVGPQGSGKTTFCGEELADYLRISQDDQGRQGHLDEFDAALARGEPRIVVDRINHRKIQRLRYLGAARTHGYRTRIVWFNADRVECIRRCRARTDHPTLPPQEAEEAVNLYFRQLQTPSRREADELTVIGPPPRYVPILDLAAEVAGRRYVIVGDVHGCFDELQDLLGQLQFDRDNDVLISVGDIVDRGPRVKETVDFLFALPHFHMVLGNHEEKLLRYLRGNQVKVGHGLETTIAAYNGEFPAELAGRLEALPLIVQVPAGFVVHAGFDPERPPEEQSEADCIYMRFSGGKSYFDEINGRIWYALWPQEGPRVFFGHIPDPAGPDEPHVVSLDGGCVFGGTLKAWDSRDGRVHAVPARQAYAIGQFYQAKPPIAAEALRLRGDYAARGLLRGDRTDDGRLVIYTYTDQCVYESAWDDITLNSRGHVFDTETGECVAWPFPKFFNLGENALSQPGSFPWDQPYDVYEKMDGWLGVLYRHDGQFKVASRGSFHSSGACWATNFLRRYDLDCLPDEATLCFEIIHPEHQIILDYQGEQNLYVLGAFNRKTGEEYPRPTVTEWAERSGLSMVPLLAPLSLEQLLHTQKSRRDVEGFVIRFADGRRVKVKTEWYLSMARVMANLTPITVWQALERGKVKQEYLMQVPEELRPLAEKYRAVLEGQYAQMALKIEHLAGPLLQQFGGRRKDIALHLETHRSEYGTIGKAVFLVLDGKRGKLDEFIRHAIYPAGNRFVELKGS